MRVGLPYLSQVEEGHRVAGVGVVAPALLSGVVELHVPDLGLAFRSTGHNMSHSREAAGQPWFSPGSALVQPWFRAGSARSQSL